MTADVIAPVIPPRARPLSRAGRGEVPRPMSLAVAPAVEPALCGAVARSRTNFAGGSASR